MIDLHSHILPDLDDGARDWNESIEMCRIAAAGGTHIIVATPHQADGTYNTENAQITSAVAELQRRVHENGLALQILPGGDVRVESISREAGWKERVMTLADNGRYMLVELPEFMSPRLFQHVLDGVKQEGITPILTHPERSVNVQLYPHCLVPLVAHGSLIQVTADSFTGTFGPRAAQCAVDLLRRRLIHIVASDAHSAVRRPPGLLRSREAVTELAGPAEASRIFDETPEYVLQGAPVDVPPPVVGKLPFLRRLLRRILGRPG